MIDRYALPEMAAVWSERNRLDTWQEVEALALEAWEELGSVPAGAAAAVRAAPPVDIADWKAREAETHHDLAAFVDVLASTMPEHGAWLHYGLTSSDVLDTSLAVTLGKAAAILLDDSAALFEAIRSLALEHRSTPMLGRTHGMWAEPITFGIKLAGWAFELRRGRRRLKAAAAETAVGKMSGAVGTYAHVPTAVERHVCEALGLKPEPAATQVVARDRHAGFLTSLALLGSSLERFAVEIRHLQRSEVGELREPFRTGQKGSSAMPHKRNPIASENATGMARLLRGWAIAGLENIALWHERDISHSSVERIVLPDACLALDYTLTRMRATVEGLEVDDARMLANLDATHGLVFSQAVLLALIESGIDRDAAYRIVQRAATIAHGESRHLRDVIAEDPEAVVDPTRLESCFDLDRILEPCQAVIERLEDLALES